MFIIRDLLPIETLRIICRWLFRISKWVWTLLIGSQLILFVYWIIRGMLLVIHLWSLGLFIGLGNFFLNPSIRMFLSFWLLIVLIWLIRISIRWEITTSFITTKDISISHFQFSFNIFQLLNCKILLTLKYDLFY